MLLFHQTAARGIDWLTRAHSNAEMLLACVKLLFTRRILCAIAADMDGRRKGKSLPVQEVKKAAEVNEVRSRVCCADVADPAASRRPAFLVNAISRTNISNPR